MITQALNKSAALVAVLIVSTCWEVANADDQATPLPNRVLLNARLHPQETTDWCWAASAQSIMHTIHGNVRQCVQAQHALPLVTANCCKTPTATACIEPAWPDFGHFGYAARRILGPLTFEQIQDQIARKRTPFAFTWDWANGGAHMMIVYGYQIRDGVKSVVIFDPLPPGDGQTRTITYDEYVEVPGDHTHSIDYVDVRHTGVEP